MTRYVAGKHMKRSKLCPQCRAWFYPEKHSQKYDSPGCAKLGKSIAAARRRQEAKPIK